MSSSRKTDNLKLNLWSGIDTPQRIDFVNDNSIIDNAIHSHISNNSVHITSSERNAWNSVYFKCSYVGDGTASRTFDTGCSFSPTWGLVYANGYPPSVVDVTNKSNYNYFAIFSNNGSMTGVSLTDGNKLKLSQSSTAVQGTEYRNFNQNGVVYTVILFR